VKPRDIVPLSKLAADGVECTDGPEADSAVQRDTGFVWHRGACVGVAEALCSQFFEEPQIECASHALPAVLRMHVGRHLDRPTVGGALAVRGPIRIANALTISFRNKPLPARQSSCDTSGELPVGRSDRFERHGSRFDERPIDCQKRRSISFYGRADSQRLGHACDLTLDMSGGWRQAKLAGRRPLL